MKERITDEMIMSADRITADMAAGYLGIGEQSCRVLARSGRIGEPVPNTNRVIFQARKLIEFKYGGSPDEERYRTAAKIFKEEGLTELATKLAVAILKVADEMKGGDVNETVRI